MSSSVNIKQFLRQTYSDLAKAEKAGDYERCMKDCHKILKFTPNDLLAQHCKVVSLIQLQKFDEALAFLKKNNNLAKECTFEKAYCEYRLNNTQDALETLSNYDPEDLCCEELMAQLLYRLDDYEQSYKLYLNILKNSSDDFDEERKTNMAATVSQMFYSPSNNLKYTPDLSTYEQHYNEACRLCALGQYKKAISVLNTANLKCREMLSEDGLNEEEIEDEVSCIKLMIAYCQQMLGNSKEASQIYSDVSKQKPSDATLVAMATNNMISLKKELSVFDAKKKMKLCQSGTLDSKFNYVQKKIICVNNVLLNLQANQYEPCKKSIQDLKNIYNEPEWAKLCEGALLCRQKSSQAAVQLFALSENEQEPSDALFFAMLQILLNEGKLHEVIEKLATWSKLADYANVQALYIAACRASDDRKLAADCLAKTLQQLEKSPVTSNHSLIAEMLNECASMCASSDEHKKSASYLDRIRGLKPDDVNVLSRLIKTYLKFDAKKAKELSLQLPAIKSLTTDVNVDELENAEFLLLGGKYSVKKASKLESTPKVDGQITPKIKKKKKRKIQLPKNLDPNVPLDPERWLPKFERSTYKKRKDKRAKDRDIGRGTQGAVSGVNEFDSSSKPDAVAASSPSPKPTGPAGATVGPRQQRPAAQKPKKKKGGGGKW